MVINRLSSPYVWSPLKQVSDSSPIAASRPEKSDREAAATGGTALAVASV
jgi:hypothetical protein